jgi:hypothetical protein
MIKIIIVIINTFVFSVNKPIEAKKMFDKFFILNWFNWGLLRPR